MPVIPFSPRRQRQTCSISPSGTLSIPRPVSDRLGWHVSSRIAVGYLETPLVLLLRVAEPGQDSYTLASQSQPDTPQTGTKLRLSALTREVLRPQVTLPLRGLLPLVLPRVPSRLALMLQEPPWISVAFSAAGLEALSHEVRGLYQLVDPFGHVRQIGSGLVKEQVGQALQDDRRTWSVRTVRYLGLTNREDILLWEQILVAQHELRYGQRPIYNQP